MRNTKDTFYKKLRLIISIVLVICMTCQFDVKTSAAAEFTISYSQYTLLKGQKKKLKVYNLPKANAKVTWTTSNKFAVTVSKKGKIKAVNYGTAVITATCKKKTVSCAVTVPDNSRSVTFDTSAVSIKENQTYKLTATSANKVSYMSGNEDIATVDSQGLIKAVNPGIVSITAKSKYGMAKCTVTVNSADVEVETSEWTTDKSVVGIRRLTKNNNIVYDNITWAKNKNIAFKIDNLDESTVKKCVWKTDDNKILSRPQTTGDSKITAQAKTLGEGFTIVSATVTDIWGKVRTYRNYVFVSNPQVNAKNIVLFGANAGSARQQFISFKGLNRYSKVQWSNSDYSSATYTTYHTKAALWGIKAGTGVMTASVDGKTFKINYTVVCPVFQEIKNVLVKNKKTTIRIAGLTGVTPRYSIRNKKVATVDSTGVITGAKAGVTYVDVKLGKMNFSYRVEIAAKGMKKIIDRAQFIVNNWKYSQGKRMKKGYYDCSALVWKGYKAYKKYHKKLGSSKYALPAGELFDYLNRKKQIVYYGYTGVDNLQPGDLIFYGDYDNAVRYSTPGRTLNIYHVSMYAGNGMVVEKGGQTINYNGTKYIVGIGRVV